MDKNSLNTNKQFMIGNGMLAFGVFAVIIIFLYMSFRFQRKADKVQTYEGVYNIELTDSFAGDSIAVYLNDSLLLDQTMPDANLKVEIKRFAEDNVLMVVDNKTDKTTPFNLNPEGSRVEVKKSGDVIYILEREADSLLEYGIKGNDKADQYDKDTHQSRIPITIRHLWVATIT